MHISILALISSHYMAHLSITPEQTAAYCSACKYQEN